MLLQPRDARLFFHLQRSLTYFVNQQTRTLPNMPPDFAGVPLEDGIKVRKALLDDISLIDQFCEQNPAALSSDELEIVASWRHFVQDNFFILPDYQDRAIFLSSTEPALAYGVIALTQPFDEIIGPQRPVWVQAVLFPFKGGIVYDGVLSRHNITFGSGIRRSLKATFKESKEKFGVILSLPPAISASIPQKRESKPRNPAPKTDIESTLTEITTLIDAFCQAHLNEEYRVLCRKLAEQLARKRPSPLLKGKPKAWASGIVRAIGLANFLHDSSQNPYMRTRDIDAGFGISESTGSSKATQIRKMFDISPFDPRWTLPSMMEQNPLAWMVMLDGMPIDIRLAPRELQEQAYFKGLIPYIPADQDKT